MRFKHNFGNDRGLPRIYDNSSAISQINAAVAEMIGRMERKLRKKYLFFAAIIYREWLK